MWSKYSVMREIGKSPLLKGCVITGVVVINNDMLLFCTVLEILDRVLSMMILPLHSSSSWMRSL